MKKSKQINKQRTSLVRIDADIKDELKLIAAAQKTSIKTLIEGVLAEVLAVKGEAV